MSRMSEFKEFLKQHDKDLRHICKLDFIIMIIKEQKNLKNISKKKEAIAYKKGYYNALEYLKTKLIKGEK